VGVLLWFLLWRAWTDGFRIVMNGGTPFISEGHNYMAYRRFIKTGYITSRRMNALRAVRCGGQATSPSADMVRVVPAGLALFRKGTCCRRAIGSYSAWTALQRLLHSTLLRIWRYCSLNRNTGCALR